VEVQASSVDSEVKTLYYDTITGMKEYNSWFKIDFNKDIFFAKGIKCLISVTVKENLKYQIFSQSYIREKFDVSDFRKCSDFEFMPLETKVRRDLSRQTWYTAGSKTCLLKSFSYVLAP